jgi:hypothetical protein
MLQSDLIFFTENWAGHGGRYGNYITYPGFSRSQDIGWNAYAEEDGERSLPPGTWAGARRIPFYNESAIGYTSKGRVNDITEYTGDGISKVLFASLADSTIDIPPPVMPSGKIDYYRGHPGNGFYLTSERAIQTGISGRDPMLWDYHFMWKAQRSTPGQYTVLGNSSRYTDPYAQSNFNSTTYTMEWDFRTVSGTIIHPSGGAYTNWLWMSG